MEDDIYLSYALADPDFTLELPALPTAEVKRRQVGASIESIMSTAVIETRRRIEQDQQKQIEQAHRFNSKPAQHVTVEKYANNFTLGEI